MYELKLEVHGSDVERYVARLESEKTGLFFSVEISHAHFETAYQSIFDENVKFAVETCTVKNPDTWTYHDLIKRQYVMSQHIWMYLGKLLCNLNIVEKGQQIGISYERNGLPITTYVTAGGQNAA